MSQIQKRPIGEELALYERVEVQTLHGRRVAWRRRYVRFKVLGRIAFQIPTRPVRISQLKVGQWVGISLCPGYWPYRPGEVIAIGPFRREAQIRFCADNSEWRVWVPRRYLRLEAQND
ncbi:MAG: hypothetical protein ACKO24_01300 [Leptolyngbyaceae cyanobacterium]